FDVLLANSDTRASLAVARSLRRHGVSVLLLADKPTDFVLYSRSAKDHVVGPSARTDPEAFGAFVLQTVCEHRIPLAVPINDKDVIAFERCRPALEAETRVAMASSRAVRSVLDKRKNLELARELGVPCPRQFELTDPAQIGEMIRCLGFPLVLKNPGPSFSTLSSPFNFRVLFAQNEEELRRYISQHCRGGMYPLFQECVTGDVHNLCCFAAAGELLAVHEYHSLRRYSGAGVLRTIVEPIPQLVTYARKLLQALEWDGVAHLGFFLSKDRSQAWYMETNGRFWASTEGSVHAGWDFPCWVYNYFRHGRRPQVGAIQLGSTTCWHMGDLLALAEYLRGGECPSTGAPEGKLRAMLSYLAGFRPGIHSDVFHWNDPLPGIMENWQYVRQFLRRGTQAAKSQPAARRTAA
ncbi:MAG: hypothetical protein ACM3PW_05875, partial [Chlamydiota bacterium]